jgi:hypothetical protein
MSPDRAKRPLSAAAPMGKLSFLSFLAIRGSLLLLCIAFLAGCATGTKKSMNAGIVSEVENLDVQVRIDKDFSVALAKERLGGADALLAVLGLAGGLAGEAMLVGTESVAIEARGGRDAQRARKLREAIATIDLQSLTQKALVDGLQATLRFKAVTVASRPEARPPAAAGILRVRIEDWGLYAGANEKATLQQVEVGFNASTSLIGRNGRLAWKRTDYFMGGAHHPIAEYGSSPVLLKNEIEETVRRYCARVVNEIRYAKQ